MPNSKRILVVDDEPDVTFYLKTFFESKGIGVRTAASGEEGLRLILSEEFSLVLLDMRMGDGLSGLEVIRRSVKAGRKTPIIVVTAVDDRNVADMALGLGAADYLTKPFILEELQHIVLARLEKGSSALPLQE
ncbi:MAG: response regulator [Candidatus Omnitrophica bacterium]|nr:response regulator [Candidatus Omnitrophota bacterium]